MNKNFKRYDKPELEKYVEKHLFSKEKLDKLNKINQCLAKKLGHWFEFYGDVISNLSSENDHLTSQFLLIATFAALEATIGTARFRRNKPEDIFYKFYKNNLLSNEIQELTDSLVKGKPYCTLKELIIQLVNRRNDLIHRAELMNLPTGDISRAVVRSSQSKGRRRGAFYINFTIERFYELNKLAIGRYLLRKPSLRLPQQDLRLWKKK